MLAALVMLPMMCGLPLMLSLCRNDGFGSQAVLGPHLAAMFLPALVTLRWPLFPRVTAPLCGGLLIAGAAAPFLASDALDWSALVVAQGAAWSLTWAARRQGARQGGRQSRRQGGAARGTSHTPLAGAALSALLVLAFGVALAHVGLPALAGWHLALGLDAAWAMCRGASAGRFVSVSPSP